MMMRDHTKLRTFELADRMAIAVYRATMRFPREEQYGLAAQILVAD
jgi:23S rRNA-intervening sequence protein